MTDTKAVPALLRALNERTVLDAVRASGPISRAELARQTGISRPTVSLVLRALLEDGLVRESEHDTEGPHYGARYYEADPEAAVVLEIAERVRAIAAPGAWIVDFTNPVGIVTRALLDGGHRAVGLCNVAIGFQRSFAGWLGVEPERVVVDQVGLNHLTWVRRVLLDEEDVLPRLLAEHGDELAEELELPRRLLDELGAVPSYYLRYFYAHDAVLREQLDSEPRAAVVQDIERNLLDLYRDPTVDERPDLLMQRGGAYYSEAALGLITSLTTGDGAVHEVDIRNDGTLAGLADDDVIEVPARVGRDGPEPLPQTPLAPELLGLVQHVAAYERLTLRAALSRDPTDARKALLAHPLIGQVELLDGLLDRLIAEAVH